MKNDSIDDNEVDWWVICTFLFSPFNPAFVFKSCSFISSISLSHSFAYISPSSPFECILSEVYVHSIHTLFHIYTHAHTHTYKCAIVGRSVVEPLAVAAIQGRDESVRMPGSPFLSISKPISDCHNKNNIHFCHPLATIPHNA